MSGLNLSRLLFSTRILVLAVIFACLPITILQQIEKEPIFEYKGAFGESEEQHLKFRRAVKNFRATGTDPCTTTGRFLNENRSNGRWYWYCYNDENGNLKWMNMKCPNNRLFDKTISKCVANLTTTTEAMSSSTTTVSSTRVSTTTGLTSSTNGMTLPSSIGPTLSTTGPTSSSTGLTSSTTGPTSSSTGLTSSTTGRTLPTSG